MRSASLRQLLSIGDADPTDHDGAGDDRQEESSHGAHLAIGVVVIHKWLTARPGSDMNPAAKETPGTVAVPGGSFDPANSGRGAAGLGVEHPPYRWRQTPGQ